MVFRAPRISRVFPRLVEGFEIKAGDPGIIRPFPQVSVIQRRFVFIYRFGAFIAIKLVATRCPAGLANMHRFVYAEAFHVADHALVLSHGVVFRPEHGGIYFFQIRQFRFVGLHAPEIRIVMRVVHGVGVHGDKVNGFNQLVQFFYVVFGISAAPGGKIVGAGNP